MYYKLVCDVTLKNIQNSQIIDHDFEKILQVLKHPPELLLERNDILKTAKGQAKIHPLYYEPTKNKEFYFAKKRKN